MIKVCKVNKSFDKKVLEDIDISLFPGKVNMLIGQSGCGKTVLMNILSGLINNFEGDVLYNGTSLMEMNYNERQNLRKKTGIVFQSCALFDFLTVKKNVTFPMEMFTDEPYDVIEDKAQEILSRLGLVASTEKFPKELSGGMQKRVAIGRAIIMNPDYLFCDEPNSGLDPRTSIIIDQLLREITQEYNTTTLVNTHDMNSVFEIGDHIILLNKGKKVWEGSSDTIFSDINDTLKDFIFCSELSKKVYHFYKEGKITSTKRSFN